MKLLPILAAWASLAAGQVAPSERAKAADYPVSGSAKDVEIGAEFLGHAIPSPRGYYSAKGYLVVDAGVFPTAGFVKVSPGQFTLRVNGTALVSQSPGLVAGALKYPDWSEQGPAARIGVGPVAIDTGPPPAGRYPGDPNGTPPGVATTTTSGDDEPDRDLTAAALPDALSDRPVRGCVFFASTTKTKKIKSLELEWNGPDGRHAVLKLR